MEKPLEKAWKSVGITGPAAEELDKICRSLVQTLLKGWALEDNPKAWVSGRDIKRGLMDRYGREFPKATWKEQVYPMLRDWYYVTCRFRGGKNGGLYYFLPATFRADLVGRQETMDDWLAAWAEHKKEQEGG